MQRHTARSFTLFILFGLLAACVPIQAPPPPTPSEPVTITVKSWFQTYQTETIGKGELALVESFQSSHPGVKVNPQGMGQDFSVYPSIRAATPPEVISDFPDLFVFKSIERNELLDLSDLWQKTGLQNFPPKAMRTFGAVNGKQYYMPYGYAWLAIYYNKAVFAQYGFTPPTTWDEFLAICETLKQKGEIPLVIPGGDNWFTLDGSWLDYLDLRINGAEFHRKLKNGEIPYSDERLRTVLETWQKLLLDGYVHPKSSKLDQIAAAGALVRTGEGMLEKQKAVMMLAGIRSVGELPKNLQDELDFFAFPTIDPAIPRAEIFDVVGYEVPNKAAHVAEAMSFAESIVSLEAQQALADANVGLVPVHPGIDLSSLSPELQKGKALIEQAEDFSFFFYWSWSDVGAYQKASNAASFFLANPKELDTFIDRLEEARQMALKNGDYVNASNY